MRPADFWTLSALEWRWLADAAGAAPPLTRAEARRLAALYPDEKT
jgi:hypothetical protein